MTIEHAWVTMFVAPGMTLMATAARGRERF
jgi:hypothetical protein